ncbi:MAG TPA: flavin reductase family protein [Burkholderiaceae bacterium]|nr:flavin reductase family protein [Burkholderiaceae bacterium]
MTDSPMIKRRVTAPHAAPSKPLCVTSEALRTAMSRFATGVTIVTCSASTGAQGITATSFQSVSLDPPLVSFCVDRRALSLAAFEQARVFAVSVLGAHQEYVARRFAQRGADKWGGIDITQGHDGVPLIAGALATFECEMHSVLDGGDHRIILGRVLRTTHGEAARPLLFFGGNITRQIAS